MTKQRRNQLIAISALIVGLVFLYQPSSVLLRGVALPLLIISAILSTLSFSEKRIIEAIAGLGLITGFSISIFAHSRRFYVVLLSTCLLRVQSLLA